MSRCPHSTFKKNSWVFIIFKDGRKLKTKWQVSSRDGRVSTTDGTFRLRSIRSIGIWRGQDK